MSDENKEPFGTLIIVIILWPLFLLPKGTNNPILGAFVWAVGWICALLALAAVISIIVGILSVGGHIQW